MAADQTPLTPQETALLQTKLREAIGLADTVIYGTKDELPGVWASVKNAVENVLTFGALTETKNRFTSLYNDALASWELKKKVLWSVVGTGQIDGKPLTRAQAEGMFSYVSTSIAAARRTIEDVKQYASGDILPNAIRDAFARPLAALSSAFDSVIALGKGVFDVVGGVGKTVGAVGSALPWIVGILVIAPFALRAFSAYRKGGATAAADVSAEQLERGRAAAGRGIATGAKAAATRGASLFAR